MGLRIESDGQTYTLSISGQTLTLTAADGTTSSVTLPLSAGAAASLSYGTSFPSGSASGQTFVFTADNSSITAKDTDGTTDKTSAVALDLFYYNGTNWVYIGFIGNRELTNEQVEDIVGALVTAGTNVTVDYDDTAGTLTISATDTQLTDEQLQDKVAAFLTAGTNVTIDYDDTTNTLTINASGGTGGGLNQEQVEDIVGAMITGGTNVTVSYDDTTGTVTINATGGGGGTQVLSEDNFPSADPADGTLLFFSADQSSFTSGKTVRNEDDSADVTSANKRDFFKYFTTGTKWVRQYSAVVVSDDPIDIITPSNNPTDEVPSKQVVGELVGDVVKKQFSLEDWNATPDTTQTVKVMLFETDDQLTLTLAPIFPGFSSEHYAYTTDYYGSISPHTADALEQVIYYSGSGQSDRYKSQWVFKTSALGGKTPAKVTIGGTEYTLTLQNSAGGSEAYLTPEISTNPFTSAVVVQVTFSDDTTMGVLKPVAFNDKASFVTWLNIQAASGTDVQYVTNFPSTDPTTDGAIVVFKADQSSFPSGKTVVDESDVVLTSANEKDVFEWDLTNTRWKLVIPGDITIAVGDLPSFEGFASTADPTSSDLIVFVDTSNSNTNSRTTIENLWVAMMTEAPAFSGAVDTDDRLLMWDSSDTSNRIKYVTINSIGAGLDGDKSDLDYVPRQYRRKTPTTAGTELGTTNARTDNSGITFPNTDSGGGNTGGDLATHLEGIGERLGDFADALNWLVVANFPSTGTAPSVNNGAAFRRLIFNTDQTAFTSGVTVVDINGNAITEAVKYDVFDWDDTNTRWVLVSENLSAADRQKLADIIETSAESELKYSDELTYSGGLDATELTAIVANVGNYKFIESSSPLPGEGGTLFAIAKAQMVTTDGSDLDEYLTTAKAALEGTDTKHNIIFVKFSDKLNGISSYQEFDGCTFATGTPTSGTGADADVRLWEIDVDPNQLDIGGADNVAPSGLDNVSFSLHYLAKTLPIPFLQPNFPATSPPNGSTLTLSEDQSSFTTGVTVRNEADNADYTSGTEGDAFKYFAEGDKWVLMIPAGAVGGGGAGGLSDDQFKEKTEAALNAAENVAITDNGTTLDVAMKDPRYSEVDMGDWNIEVSSGALVNGDAIFINNTELRISDTDADSNDKTTPLAGINANDIIVIESQSDTTKRVYFQVTSSSVVGTAPVLFYRFLGQLLSYSAPLTEVNVDEAEVNVYRSYIPAVFTEEQVRDTVAAQATQGTGISIVNDDDADTLTFSTDATRFITGSNFPTTNPRDGTVLLFNADQSAPVVPTGTSIRDEDDGADVSAVNKDDVFKFFESSSKWIRQVRGIKLKNYAKLDNTADKIPQGDLDPLALGGDKQTFTRTFVNKIATNLLNGEFTINGGTLYFDNNAADETDEESKITGISSSDFLVIDSVGVRLDISASPTNFAAGVTQLNGASYSNEGVPLDLNNLSYGSDYDFVTRTAPTVKGGDVSSDVTKTRPPKSLYYASLGYGTLNTTVFINAGEAFSDFKYIQIIAIDNHNRLNEVTLPQAVWANANNGVRISKSDGDLVVVWVSDTSFQLLAANYWSLRSIYAW